MPTYDYKCIEGHVQTISHGFVNEPKVYCGKCSAPMRKVFSPPAVTFKGSGFAINEPK